MPIPERIRDVAAGMGRAAVAVLVAGVVVTLIVWALAQAAQGN